MTCNITKIIYCYYTNYTGVASRRSVISVVSTGIYYNIVATVVLFACQEILIARPILKTASRVVLLRMFNRKLGNEFTVIFHENTM